MAGTHPRLRTGAAVKNGLNTAKRDVATLKTKVAAAQSSISTLKTSVATAKSDIATLKADDATVQGNITSINGQLAAGAAALTQINSALTNSTTGLVGLNAARPQFGVFGSTGTIAAGTGQASGASGPKTNAIEGTGVFANSYVVDFGNDVSLRFLHVTQFPGTNASTNRVGMAANCSAAATLCGFVEGSADSSKNHVVVQFGNVGGAAPPSGWEVAAISG